MRAFLALPVESPALEEATALCEILRGQVQAVRWAPPATLHITLHFFGAIDDRAASCALDALAPAFAATAPLRLRLSGLGSFPHTGAPRVLWWGIAGELERLGQLAAVCTEVLAREGFAVEERPFRPHCTLGRPRQPWPGPARRRWQTAVAAVPATAAFTSHGALLYESVPSAAGARHVPRARLPLAG